MRDICYNAGYPAKHGRRLMPKSLHCVICGRVQGVFFRAFVVEQAQTLDLKGWARNLPGGKLEVLAQGDVAVIEDFAARLRQGPPLARVDAVEIQWTDHETEYKNFQIKR